MDAKALLWLLCFLPFAFGSDYRCLRIRGICQRYNLYCAGSYVSGKCSGGFNRRCCVPKIGSDYYCTSRGGTCQDNHLHCSGSYQSGLCSGSASRQCCLVTSGSDSACLSIGGTCQDDHAHCGGTYVSGKCAGDAHRRCCTSHSATDIGGCANVKIYSRDSWGARSPKHVTTMHTPASLFFIHHTEGNPCHDFATCARTLRGIQNYHMDSRGWSDIGYSFLVGEDGNVYEGRGWHHVGAHTQGYNSRGFAASVMGSFMTHVPNNAALNAIQNLIKCGVSKGYISSSYSLYGHRDVGQTDCPGTALYNLIKTWPHYNTHKP